MSKILQCLNAFVWGAPSLFLILGVGLFLTILLRGVQITRLPRALACFWRKLRSKESTATGTTPFRALCTALAATVGTGNLVGVAGAISLGGPGAIFWMWVSGILGMITKYAEATLAVRYRKKTPQGYIGGPMYVITQGLGERYRPLAVCYCVCAIAASFGVGNAAQINAVVSGINSVLVSCGGSATTAGNLLMGLLLAWSLGSMLLGGEKRIGAAAELLVPFAATAYILLCFGVLVCRIDAIPGAFAAIVQGAISPKAVTGGALGSAFQAMRIGCSRGVFTNEAGMGTASIAHAAADVSHPAEQGLMGIMEVFLDTIVICTMTALVILTSGIPVPYGTDAGGNLASTAFSSVYGDSAAVILAIALTLFAVATVLGWGLYGGRCVEFLFDRKGWKIYLWAQIVTIILSSVMDTAVVWQFSELLNGLMVIPNLLTLTLLAPEVVRLTEGYKSMVRHAPRHR